jgi:hypothetical protein
MNNKINFEVLNLYSTYEYNSKSSVLDAAFFLLNDENYEINYNMISCAYSFILFVYSMICINLLNQDDNKTLDLIGNDNYAKILLYNLIYMNDHNHDISNIIYHNLYKNIDFNGLINEYIYNSSKEKDDIDYIDDFYLQEVEDYIDSTYLNQNLLIELDENKLDEIENIKKWKIYLFIVVYYYIILKNEINIHSRKTGPYILLKTLINSYIVCNFIVKLQSIDLDDKEELIDFLEKNEYFNKIYENVIKLFLNIVNGGIEISFESFNFYFSFNSIEDESESTFLNNIFDDIFLLKENFHNYTRTEADIILVNTIKNLFTEDKVITCLNDLRNIVNIISQENNSYNLNDFYENILNIFLDNNIDISIIEDIQNESNNYTIMIQELFDGMMYSFIHIDIAETEIKISYIFNNLCNKINNLYKNKELIGYIFQINESSENKANYFFENIINLYKKILMVKFDYDFYENSEEYSDNQEHDEPCYDDFHLKNLSKIDSIIFNEYENDNSIEIGISSLGKKKTPKIAITKTLLYSNNCYCNNNISLNNLKNDFFNSVC